MLERDALGRIVRTARKPRTVKVCACGSHAFTPATRGFVAIVSVEDRHLLDRGAIWTQVSGRCFYAARRATNSRSPELVHAIVLPTDGRDRDHINGNGLDNRRENLRLVTRAQNNQNRHRQVGRSRFLGVTFHTSSSRWRAFHAVGGRQISCGYFDDEIAAARARDAFVAGLDDDYVKLNFPPESASHA